MKKLLSTIFAIVLVLSMTMSAFAAEKNITNGEVMKNGTITINGVSDDTTYEIYKLLHLYGYDTTSSAYSYTIEDAWAGFFVDNADPLVDDAMNYVTVDDAGYVTWKASEDDATIAAFAKLALEYAKANDVDPVRSSENAGEFVVTGEKGVFSDLTLGYYLVDSTMGALCGLTTTNPNASINAKNGIPTLDKQVEEDSTIMWGDSNTADIGQTVPFLVTINVHAGAENYVLHDVMDAGLTFGSVSKIEHIVPGGSNTVAVAGTDYTVWTKEGITTSTDDDTTDGCTFEVRFSKAFCEGLKANDKILVYYDAMLNRNAVIAGAGNLNTAWLGYGEGKETNIDTTVTKTFAIDIIKTDSQNKLLDGAEFRIYDAATGGNEVEVVLMDDGETYRRARVDETGVAIVVKDGKVRVAGFDNGTYYLEETVAPDGYNKLTARKEFAIADSNLDATFNGSIYSTGSGVQVVNKTGSMLPETGAMGTMMFVTFGTMAVLGAGVLLVTKKRMSMIQE